MKKFSCGSTVTAIFLASQLVVDVGSAFMAAGIGGQKMLDGSLTFAQSGYPGSGATAERIFQNKKAATDLAYMVLGYK